MSAAEGHSPGSRRAELAKARQSRRPSRLGRPAGITAGPDRILDRSEGFPQLLAQVWKQANSAPDAAAAVDTLLTLYGHVPADVQLRAFRLTEESALWVLRGLTWRRDAEKDLDDAESAAASGYTGEIGLTTTGRVAVGVPGATPISEQYDLVDGVIRVPWTAADIDAYEQHVRHATTEFAESVADCRIWLHGLGTEDRNVLLDELVDAALRTAPFMLYQEAQLYTNFRETNNLAGKTLFPGHSDCLLSALKNKSLGEWSDSDAMVVVCLALLIRSSGYARIEEANGTQLTLQHVAELLDRARRTYNSVPHGTRIAAADDVRVEALVGLASQLRSRREELVGTVRVYREIHGPLMHKIERIAGDVGEVAAVRETAMSEQLCARLPVSGRDIAEMTTGLGVDPGWLIEPHGDFSTGLESLIHVTVGAAREAFDADFAMSRGLRSLTRLIRSLGSRDWATIVGWELPEFFCCVVPDPGARRFFGDSAAQLADIAWAMSARMQYNSWHFLAGNLPKVPEVVARDHFVPPAVPDISYYSDQHHHGHVAARVRFSIRSPQPVHIANRRFGGFIDLRLLRCEGPAFTEQDLLVAHRTSAFIAAATTQAAVLAAEHDVAVTAFDPSWHWSTITDSVAQAQTDEHVRR